MRTANVNVSLVRTLRVEWLTIKPIEVKSFTFPNNVRRMVSLLET